MFDLVLGWVKIWRITIYLESGILEYLHLISEPSLPPGYSYIFPSSPPSELLARLHTAKVFGRDDYHLVGLLKHGKSFNYNEFVSRGKAYEN